MKGSYVGSLELPPVPPPQPHGDSSLIPSFFPLASFLPISFEIFGLQVVTHCSENLCSTPAVPLTKYEKLM